MDSVQNIFVHIERINYICGTIDYETQILIINENNDLALVMMADGALAQNNTDSTYYIDAYVEIFVPLLDKRSSKLEQLLRQNSIKVAETAKSPSGIDIDAVMSETQYAELKNKLDE